jgi:hypothetical protein
MKQTIAILAGALLALSTGCSGSSAGSSSSGSTGGRNAATGTTSTSGSTSHGSSGSSGSTAANSTSGSTSTTTAGSSGSTGASSSSGSSGSTGASSASGSSGTTGSASGSTGSSGSTGVVDPGTPITVISIEDFHPAAVDGGEQRVPEYALPGRFSALIPLGDGGYTELPDVGLDGGYDSIPGGPNSGSFFLHQTFGQYVQTTSHTVDWSQDFLGKSNYTPVNQATPVTFNLTGFTPIGATDIIELGALHDDGFEDYSLQSAVSYPDAGSTFLVNETSVMGTVDWSTYATNTNDGQAAGVDPGDPFFAAKITFFDGGSGGADTFNRLDSFADLTGKFVLNAQATTVTAAAVTYPPTRAFVTVLTRVPTPIESQLPAGNTYAGTGYDVGTLPQASTIGVSTNNDLAFGFVSPRPTPAPVNLNFTYADPYPAPWTEYYDIARYYSMPITVSVTPSVTLDEGASFRSLDTVANLPATQGPTLGPVSAILVNGQSADTNLSPIGTTPTISWNAPSVGTPTAYRLRLYEVTVDSTTNTATTNSRGYVLLLPTTTSFTYPAGRFVVGHQYIIRVAAISEPNSSLDLRPARSTLPYQDSIVSTHLLNP